MTRLIFGERIAAGATYRLGASAAVWNASGDRILLTRRADNGQWCLPAGGLEPGERLAEACEREVGEETGLEVRVTRLIGIYSSPDVVIQYVDHGPFQMVAAHFEVEVIGGALATSDETTELGYFSLSEIDDLDLMAHHRERILDSYRHELAAFVR